MWLAGDKSRPQFTYGLLQSSPLRLSDDVSYFDAEGEEKHILGRDTWRREEFVWRGAGLLSIATSRWRVSGANDGRSLLVVRFSQSLVSPAGIDLIVREGSEIPELRKVVAASTEELGLSPEDFASLGWLGIS